MMSAIQKTGTPAVDGAGLRMLQQYRGGEPLSEFSEALRAVTQAVDACQKPGSVTLKVTISPSGNAMKVQSEVSMKTPKLPGQAAIFFADEQHNLVREDPNQMDMELRAAPGGRAEEGVVLKEVVG